MSEVSSQPEEIAKRYPLTTSWTTRLESFSRRIWTRLAGHDVFISYAQSDGWVYAKGLRKRLEAADPGLLVFRDETALEAGSPLRAELRREVRLCRLLVVVVSPGVEASSWVAEEVEARVQVYPPGGRPMIPAPQSGDLESVLRALRAALKVVAEARRLDEGVVDHVVETLEAGGMDSLAPTLSAMAMADAFQVFLQYW